MARLPLHPLLLLLTLLLATSCLGRRRYRQQQNTIPEQEKNYYEILGLEAGPETPDSKIKQAYRHLSKKLHPDLNPSDEAKNKYQDVQEAYGVLSDRKRRKVYDMMGHEGLKQLEQASQRGGRAQDPFSNFFGFGGGDSGPERGPDIQMTIRVTLDDVYNGAEHTVPLAKQKLKNWEVVRKCMKCKARPPTVQNVQIGPGMVMRQEVPPDCRGECGPRGAVTRKQVNMEVKIEEGVPEGQTLTYELEADEYPDRLPGDVKFVVETSPHKMFTRDGNNLHMKLVISLLEALVGFEKTFTHMDGHEFVVARNAPTHHGFKMTLTGEGMPKHHVPSEKGDLIVTFEVKFPTRVTPEQAEQFKKILS